VAEDGVSLAQRRSGARQPLGRARRHGARGARRGALAAQRLQRRRGCQRGGEGGGAMAELSRRRDRPGTCGSRRALPPRVVAPRSMQARMHAPTLTRQLASGRGAAPAALRAPQRASRSHGAARAPRAPRAALDQQPPRNGARCGAVRPRGIRGRLLVLRRSNTTRRADHDARCATRRPAEEDSVLDAFFVGRALAEARAHVALGAPAAAPDAPARA
jgi:hypothetical protein